MSGAFPARVLLPDHRAVMSSGIDLAQVSDLLRTRRRALQPEDVGLSRGPRRRTPGLRREEAAALCSMSAAYYSRLERHRSERHRGPRPSPVMLAGIARGLRFTRAGRDQLFAAAGYAIDDHRELAHLDPGVMHVLGRLSDTPALAIDPLGEVLYQTPSARTLFGDLTGYTGWARSTYHRWFTDPAERRRHPAGEHLLIGAEIAADLHHTLAHRHDHAAATDLVRLLLHRSDEFAELWRRAPAGVQPARQCRIVHPELGLIDLQRETLSCVDAGQRVVIYLAVPGSDSHTKLDLSAVVGHHRFDGGHEG